MDTPDSKINNNGALNEWQLLLDDGDDQLLKGLGETRNLNPER